LILFADTYFENGEWGSGGVGEWGSGRVREWESEGVKTLRVYFEVNTIPNLSS
jgi:hypothetical protein